MRVFGLSLDPTLIVALAALALFLYKLRCVIRSTLAYRKHTDNNG